MPKGYFSLVLHAHLPFVRHPEHPEFLEEDWLFEAITEVYLPLLDVLTTLRDEGHGPRLALSLSPPLCEMLSDELLRGRYTRHLENLLALAEKESERTRRVAPEFHPAASMYRSLLARALRLWTEDFRRDIPRAFRALQDEGTIELLTSCATHGFLPLVSTDAARRAQVAVAVANYRKHFGRKPRGIWLPECAYEPGLESFLGGEEIEYFVADSRALLHGTPRPRFGIHAPVRCPNGVAVFARDVETGEQVWSSKTGYPGDPAYREFYRDAGWDLPVGYLRPHLHRDGVRRGLGLKYHRVTGHDVPLGRKEPYDPQAARARAEAHAEHFAHRLAAQAARLEGFLGGRAPVVVAPYDAELFGHWWFEGPQFLGLLFRRLATLRDEVEAVTPGHFLDLNFDTQTQRPAGSSWGAGGYYSVWLNEKTSWMYPQQHAAEARMTALADRFRADAPDETTRRALKQSARELLLAQSSDWAFQVTHGTTVEYATRRFRTHLHRFGLLASDIEAGTIDSERLTEIERRDNIFSEIDYRHFCTDDASG